MIIELHSDIQPHSVEEVKGLVAELGYKITEVVTQRCCYLVASGKNEIDIRLIGALPGVKDVHRVSDSYKLVSRKWKATPTTLHLDDDVNITAGGFTFMLGPCSIEDPTQVESVLKFLKDQGVSIMRGGAFKPRTSPYAFRGLGLDGLKMFYETAKAQGIKVISEVMEISQIGRMYDYVDIYQVGARNTQNFNLLHELGNVDKPVLLKRGMSGTIEELLQSAEYVFANGNEKLILCERGIRTYEKSYRNTMDINAVPVLKSKTHLPVIVDPSHGTGKRSYVTPIALAAVVAGADGLLLEIHEKPETALSDGEQTLNYKEAAELIRKARQLCELRCSWETGNGA